MHSVLLLLHLFLFADDAYILRRPARMHRFTPDSSIRPLLVTQSRNDYERPTNLTGFKFLTRVIAELGLDVACGSRTSGPPLDALSITFQRGFDFT